MNRSIQILKIFIPAFLMVLVFLPGAHAQRWKKVRYEFHAGAGASNFLGELGGANQIGTNYFRDFEWSETQFGIALGLRYKLSDFFAFNTHFTYGSVSGDDKLTTEEYRSYRNLSFTSRIIEWNLNFEAAFQQEQVGHRYRLRRVKGQKGYEIYAYGFVGIGFFNFDPKADIKGNTYRLQPLGTEGQGLVPTRKKYQLWQFCIPIGFGFKYTIDAKWGVGIEYGMRKTFTDYIDDVSTTYFDNSEIRAAYGNIAALLADRSDRTIPGRTSADSQRGDPRDLDAYMFAIFSINYKIKTNRGGLPRF
ncbi:MAG TPA: DUF6089 family protein [Bacteroidia bacterium]|nr:DUF6089 family protein [Bacteroidia bacterium]